MLWLALRRGLVTINHSFFSFCALVVACSQTRISYNRVFFEGYGFVVVACSQTRISYNFDVYVDGAWVLWLALRRGLVTINHSKHYIVVELWLALRRGLVTISSRISRSNPSCGLLSDAD